ncbi:MAG TPA: beta-ketoacyl synthase N-terminal-like domain-containing protein, partial [Vicinamibacterales bacterium]|nr:beta-ketoacyl synthase N-terminal-like domain-containing protein [Vicinamibacterales bacterium]
MEPRPRVVVTGIGVVTSIGVGAEAFWRALLAGACGIGLVESFDTSRYGVHIGGEVKRFDPAPFIRRLRRDSV